MFQIWTRNPPILQYINIFYLLILVTCPLPLEGYGYVSPGTRQHLLPPRRPRFMGPKIPNYAAGHRQIKVHLFWGVKYRNLISKTSDQSSRIPQGYSVIGCSVGIPTVSFHYCLHSVVSIEKKKNQAQLCRKDICHQSDLAARVSAVTREGDASPLPASPSGTGLFPEAGVPALPVPFKVTPSLWRCVHFYPLLSANLWMCECHLPLPPNPHLTPSLPLYAHPSVSHPHVSLSISLPLSITPSFSAILSQCEKA